VHNSDSDVDDFISIQSYHILERDFENVGYHYVIERSGDIKKGRPENYHGAHVAENDINKKSIGIALCGKFETKGPNDNQIKSLKLLLKSLIDKYSLSKENIVPHRHFTTKKTCYGSYMDDNWAQLIINEEDIDYKKKFEKCEYEKKKEQESFISAIIRLFRIRK